MADERLNRLLGVSVLRLLREARAAGVRDPAAMVRDLFRDPARRVQIVQRRLGLAEGSLTFAQWSDVVDSALRLDAAQPPAPPRADGPIAIVGIPASEYGGSMFERF